jgi:hypothetical protein
MRKAPHAAGSQDDGDEEGDGAVVLRAWVGRTVVSKRRVAEQSTAARTRNGVITVVGCN